MSIQKTGYAGWIKRCLPALLIFLVLVMSGCSPEQSAPEKLREIDADLQEYVTKLLIAADRLEQMERELAFVDPAFDVQMSAHNVRDSVLEIINSIADTRGELSVIADGLE